MGLIIRFSAIHGAGCFTTTAIGKGERVAEYTGRRLTRAQANAIGQHSPITYMFGLGDGSTVIEGRCTAMYINHSCEPNCESSEEDGRIWITALCDIGAGEELTYDYCLYDGDEDEAICHCGAANCRGTMYSKEEIRRRKAARKKRGSRRPGR